MSSASSKRRGRKNSWLQEQWVAYRKSMLESPAFLALSLSGHRVLARVGLEHLRHKGVENGWLPVTYQDFALSNVDKGSISAALAECIALGFLQITKKGRAGNGDSRTCNLYRLTYLPTSSPKEGPTDEWKHIKDPKAIAAAVRKKFERKRKSPSGEQSAKPEGKAKRRRRAAADPSPTLFDAIEAPPTTRVKLRVVK
jgi:hypothetical protein